MEKRVSSLDCYSHRLRLGVKMFVPSECSRNKAQCAVVIFAGGVGSRMRGAKTPKQFLKLGGKPIIAHTLDHFEKHQMIDAIVVVSVESGMARMHQIVTEGHYKKVVSIVPGGETGQDSIYNGLHELDELGVMGEGSVVLIHDGVRPLIDAETITACIESVRANGCTAVVAPASETIIEERNGVVERVVDRSRCKLARAPQGFFFDEILSAQEHARFSGRHDYIDSISLMADQGYEIHTVEGPVDNIKITTRRDFFAYKGFMDYKELEQLWE